MSGCTSATLPPVNLYATECLHPVVLRIDEQLGGAASARQDILPRLIVWLTPPLALFVWQPSTASVVHCQSSVR